LGHIAILPIKKPTDW